MNWLKVVIVIAMVVAVFTLLIMGARNGRDRKKSPESWTQALKASPADFLALIYKIRPK